MQRGSRRPIAALLAAALLVPLLATLSAPPVAAAPDPRPNIVLIMLDDARLDQMDTYMPNTLGLIRDQGVDFSQGVVNGSECCPSRATLFSGQYNHNHRVFTSGDPYGWQAFDEANSLAHWLQDAGYYTSFTGKYLNGYGLQAPAVVPAGWDDWYGGAGEWTYYYKNGKIQTTSGALVDMPAGSYQADLHNAHVVDILETHAPADEPFFVNYAPTAPHVGITQPGGYAWPWPAPRHNDTVTDPYPVSPNYNEADNSDKPSLIAGKPLWSETSLNGLQAQWRAGIETMRAVDDGVGDMVQALDDAGELDNTVFIFTSDNGMFYGEHRLWGKYWPYEEVIRVPFYMRGPGIPVGATRTQQVGIVDIPATIVDIADATPSLPLDGVSVLPMIANASLGTSRVVAVEAGPPGGNTAWRQARDGHYSYTEYENGDREFYDLISDPYQLQNAINNAFYAGVISTFEGHLDQLRSCVGAGCHIGLAGYPSPVSAPSVASISPSADITAGGRQITVLGNGFTGATSVGFGGAPAPSMTVVSDTEITAEAPPHAVGTVAVTVTGPGGTSAPGQFDDDFAYITTPSPPTISTPSPSIVNTAGGISVTINGTNLTHIEEVTFDGIPGTSLNVSSPTQLTVVSPPNSAGSANVVASTPWANSNTGSVTYQVPGPAPTVTKVAPAQGSTAGGTVVTLTGTNFNHVTQVTFGGMVAPSFIVDSPTQLRVTSPPYPAYLVNINVTTWAGTSPSVAYKTWYTFKNSPVPNIDLIAPSQGSTAGGTVVTITGTGFTGATGVSFGTVPAASFTVNSDTRITATTPAYGPYLVTVKVTGPGGVSPSEGWTTFFGFQTPSAPPNLDARTPTQGPIAGGTVVTITGTNFTGVTQVTFGGKAGTNLQVLSSTQLRITTPSFSQPYLVAIRITGPGGTSPTEGWLTTFGYV